MEGHLVLLAMNREDRYVGDKVFIEEIAALHTFRSAGVCRPLPS